VIREDDSSSQLHYALRRWAPDLFGGYEDMLADDTPIGGHFNRFCNHFYDPVKQASESHS
jgi:hypothetical protein